MAIRLPWPAEPPSGCRGWKEGSFWAPVWVIQADEALSHHWKQQASGLPGVCRWRRLAGQPPTAGRGRGQVWRWVDTSGPTLQVSLWGSGSKRATNQKGPTLLLFILRC